MPSSSSRSAASNSGGLNPLHVTSKVSSSRGTEIDMTHLSKNGEVAAGRLSTESHNILWKQHTKARHFLYVTLSVVTVGIFHLFCNAYDGIKLWFLTCDCPPSEADTALLLEEDDSRYISSVTHCFVDGQHFAALEFACVRYLASERNHYAATRIPDVPIEFSLYLSHREEPALPSREVLAAQYGPNKMTLPTSTFLDVLMKTLVHPFYLFQYFAVAVWAAEDYLIYAAVILLITGGAVYLTAAETVFNLKRLRDLAGISNMVDVIHANGTIVSVPDTDLVPGDRIVIKDGIHLPCDAVLLSGRVTVDESMLTGESVPVTKTPMERGISNEEIAKRNGNIVFSGTRVLATSTEAGAEHCVGLVYRTSFRSTKGQLVAALLTPRDDFLSFFSDALWVILFMLIIATLLYVWSASNLRREGVGWSDVCQRYLDAITIAVPPALTASLTVATGISVQRLKEKNIYVSETVRVNWAGVVGAACFDKTGTLTEERLHFRGITVSSESGSSNELLSVEISPEEELPADCLELLATCHCLSLIDGTPRGDPLEVELMRASGFALEATTGVGGKMCALSGPPSAETRFEIVKHFEFTADKLRAASLVRRPNNRLALYVKGSPEMLLSICKKETVPSDIDKMLATLARRGLRVIAMASRDVPEEVTHLAQMPSQAELEEGLVFMGLCFLSNSLKAETVSTIETLKKANIVSNMITGDHLFTAVAIAKECALLVEGEVHIIDANPSSTSIIEIFKYSDMDKPLQMTLHELLCSAHEAKTNGEHMQIAVSGRGLNAVRNCTPHLVQQLVRCTQVFARMKPSDKQAIVEELLNVNEREILEDKTAHSDTALTNNQRSESNERHSLAEMFHLQDDGRGQLFVLFCGDGANDMAALRAATVGVSLCEAETSVAAPVTSRGQTPGSVIEVIKEGRCSLITAYVLVSFNIMYAVIQLFMACMMYNYGLRVGDSTYLIQDLFFTLVLALAISYSPPADVLSAELPPQRFFTRFFSFKLFSQMLCFPIFQALALRALSQQDWYNRYDADGDPLVDTYSYEASVISHVGLAQILIASVVSTIDEPFRKPWFTNIYHVTCLVLQTIYILWQMFSRREYFLRHVIEIKPLPINFCFAILALIGANVLVSLLLNSFAERCLKISPATTKK